MPNEKNDKYEEIENNDLQTPGLDEEGGDDLDEDMDDEDMMEPDTVGARHEGVVDEESGKGDDSIDNDRNPQDSDPSE